MNLKERLMEQKFLSEMKGYTNVIIEQLKCTNDEAAYSYKLCFYAQFLGFINSNFLYYNSNGINIKKIYDTLSVDIEILDNIRKHLNSEETLNEKNSDSIYYCYQNGREFQCSNPEKMLNHLLRLHMKIAAASLERGERKNCIQLKKFI